MTEVRTYPFAVPPLRHSYDAYAPYIDQETMRLHHDRHHQAYVDKLNAAIKDHDELHGRSIEDILRGLNEVPPAIRQTVPDQGGGHANHQFLWKIMRPGPAAEPTGDLRAAIEDAFGTYGSFQEQFEQATAALFGSGWAFLVIDPADGNRLKVHTTPNQDSVLLESLPGLMCCDLWEHAYYLSHQNRRPEYLAAWWNVIDWDVVAQRHQGILAGASQL